MAKSVRGLLSDIMNWKPSKLRSQVQEMKRSFSMDALSDRNKTEEERCNCCTTVLSKLDKIKGVKQKYQKCAHCGNIVCRFCRENERCHECTIRLTTVRDPDNLMTLSRETLISYLVALHYPEQTFKKWPKPYLVKQLLTRFQVHENWDPAVYSVQRENSDSKQKRNPREKTVKHQKREKNRQSDEMGTWKIKTNGSPRYECIGDHIYHVPFQIDRSRSEAGPEAERRMATRNRRSASLQDISSARYFDCLTVAEMKAILKRSLESNSNIDREELQLILTLLWKKENDRQQQEQSHAQSSTAGQSRASSQRWRGSRVSQETIPPSTQRRTMSTSYTNVEPQWPSYPNVHSPRRVRFAYNHETPPSQWPSTSFQDSPQDHRQGHHHHRRYHQRQEPQSPLMKKAISMQDIQRPRTMRDTADPNAMARSHSTGPNPESYDPNLPLVMEQLKYKLQQSPRTPTSPRWQ